VHPHHAADLTREALPALHEMARDSAVVAAGECGLDYFRDFSPRDLQRRAFGWQLEIAVDTGKPVFLHQRDAHEDFVAMLSDYAPRLAGGVAHCFTAGAKERDAYLELGLHIGITGWICDERRGSHLREVVKGIPGDRLLLETDAPYLLPRDLKPAPKSRRNEPHFLPHVAAVIAAARGESLESLARTATDNTRRLFRLPT
jgi:TatD DNase family protein